MLKITRKGHLQEHVQGRNNNTTKHSKRLLEITKESDSNKLDLLTSKEEFLKKTVIFMIDINSSITSFCNARWWYFKQFPNGGHIGSNPHLLKQQVDLIYEELRTKMSNYFPK